MKKDEHKEAKTLKQQISDGVDVEYSEELADHADKVAQTRRRQAEQRQRNK